MLWMLDNRAEIKMSKGAMMKNGISRRVILKAAVIGSCYSVACSSLPLMAWAGDDPSVQHPMMKPKKIYQ